MTREEAIKILADLTDNLFLHTWEEQYKALHMAIEALSAEAVKGEWIKKPHRKYLPMDCPWPDGEDYDEETHSCTVYHWHCSCCDYDMHEFMKSWYNYCPNCGAKMKGGDSE